MPLLLATIPVIWHWKLLNRGIELRLIERDQPAIVLDEELEESSSQDPWSVPETELELEQSSESEGY